ncbi:hypothetical protein ACFXHA_36430 [Nocardia sp. NPDC059240]|uniref:hypothetical protein n=1 Tax=Nocardia sp. NPDC059240 TaxID=3346786 RepID=UPI003687E098
MNRTVLLCLLIIIASLVSTLVAVTAAILVKRAGTRWELSLLTGGGSFAGSLTVLLLIINTVASAH